jgi:hypothetical protein
VLADRVKHVQEQDLLALIRQAQATVTRTPCLRNQLQLRQ